MTRDWEADFSQWSKPPEEAEQERCENAITGIRNAIAGSDELKGRTLKVFPQGSYRNRVNVRQDSDVDVGVLCTDSFISYYPKGTSRETFGISPATYSYRQFKDELERALVAYFGRRSVRRGNKAIDVRENSHHVEADVAPFFAYRRYFDDGSYRRGVALRPDSGGTVHNYPERLLESWPDKPHHYENGVSKNTATGRRYKGVVRILKKLRNELSDEGVALAESVPGFLIECMTWNAPDASFEGETWDERAQAVLKHLWLRTGDDASCKGWYEVNGIKYLFHSTQKWTRKQAHALVNTIWIYVGMRA